MKKRLTACMLACFMILLVGCSSNTAKEAAKNEAKTETSFPAGNTETQSQEETSTEQKSAVIQEKTPNTTEKAKIVDESRAITNVQSKSAEEKSPEKTKAEPSKQANTPTASEKHTEQSKEPTSGTQKPTEKPKEPKSTEPPKQTFDVGEYVSYAKNYKPCMISFINLAVLFAAKVADNALSTTKTILVQRSRWILAGIAVIISDFIYFWITKRVVSANNEIAMLVVAVAGGVGCSLACFINEKMSKDRTYVNVIMSDDLEEMKRLRDFLAKHHITNVASDSYTLDWNAKTISITAYPETKAESLLINEFIADSSTKFKRVIQPA